MVNVGGLSMKILGISPGTKNGNNDTMCRVALEEAKEMGCDIEFIHLFDWNIKPCYWMCRLFKSSRNGQGDGLFAEGRLCSAI